MEGSRAAVPLSGVSCLTRGGIADIKSCEYPGLRSPLAHVRAAVVAVTLERLGAVKQRGAAQDDVIQ